MSPWKICFRPPEGLVITIYTRNGLSRLRVGLLPLQPMPARRIHANSHAAKLRLQTECRNAVSRGGECTMANCGESRNSHEISEKGQAGWPMTGVNDFIFVRRSHPFAAGCDAPTLHQFRINFRKFVSGHGSHRGNDIVRLISSCRANIDYRFAG